MSIFSNLGQGRQPQQQDPRQAVQQIKADPSAFLQRAGLTVPEGMTDPLQMARHLLDSGQVTGPRAQLARRLMGGR